jgi:hypothetical protein
MSQLKNATLMQDVVDLVLHAEKIVIICGARVILTAPFH